MTGVYANITQQDPAVVERMAAAQEVRAASPSQRAMREAYFAEINFPNGALVLEVGCGTGAVSRALAVWPNVAEVVGIDPSPDFIAKAKELSAQLSNVAFREGDGRTLDRADASVDVVVFHTVLGQMPEPSKGLTEAHRVLKKGGWLAVFDGDYTTASIGTGDNDPLQACVDAMIDAVVADKWLTRRLPRLIREVGFEPMPLRSYGFAETLEVEYMITVVDRGLTRWCLIGGSARSWPTRSRLKPVAVWSQESSSDTSPTPASWPAGLKGGELANASRCHDGLGQPWAAANKLLLAERVDAGTSRDGYPAG